MGRPDRALSIRQPHAWLIVYGLKPVENRSRRTHYRGRILVHASQRPDREAYERYATRGVQMPPLEEMPTGGFVGEVDIVGCEETSESPYYIPGNFAWLLDAPEPIEFEAAKGRLGIWRTTPQTEPSEQIPSAASGLQASAPQTEGE